jgi:hypothetical protein
MVGSPALNRIIEVRVLSPQPTLRSRPCGGFCIYGDNMAATLNAMLTQNSSQSGTTLAGAFPQVTPNGVASQNLDLLQIVSKKGGAILLNVDYLGAVHAPASSPTSGTRVGQFATDFQSSDSPSVAQLFANAFVNPSLQDILQVINAGGNIHYYLDYLGVAHGS